MEIKNVMLFAGVWQGFLFPILDIGTTFLQFSSAFLGVVIGIITIFQKIKKSKK